MRNLFISLLSGLFIISCATTPATDPTDPNINETADQFVARINQEIIENSRENEAAYWVYSTYISGH